MLTPLSSPPLHPSPSSNTKSHSNYPFIIGHLFSLFYPYLYPFKSFTFPPKSGSCEFPPPHRPLSVLKIKRAVSLFLINLLYPPPPRTFFSSFYSGRTKYSALVSRLNKLSEEYLSPQKTQKAAVFFIQKILGRRLI
jgi:hypothetical protein